MANYKPKACKLCRATFTPTGSRALYCSAKCRKQAEKKYQEQYYNKHKREYIKRALEWRKLNPEAHRNAVRKSMRKWRTEAPEGAREYARNWHLKHFESNPEAVRESRRKALKRWRKNNPEASRRSNNKWKAANPGKVGAAASRRAKAELEGTATPKLIKAKWEAGDKACILCGDAIDPTLKAPHNMSRTIEHLTPIARGGRHDIDNIDFAHRSCNASKGTKTLEEYREWRKQAT